MREKEFENDTTFTLPLLREAMRAVLPKSDAILCYLFGSVLFARFCFCFVNPVFNAETVLRTAALLLLTLGAYSFPSLLFPLVFGTYRFRGLCRQFRSRSPHITFSLYSDCIKARLPDRRVLSFPYSDLISLKKTASLLILSFAGETDLFLRLDSFHGSTAEDVIPFLRGVMKKSNI